MLSCRISNFTSLCRRQQAVLVLASVALVTIVLFSNTGRKPARTDEPGHVLARTLMARRDRCKPPNLEPWNALAKKYFVLPEPLRCHESEPNFVYVDNGTFRISESASEKYGKITCDYRPIVRIDDYHETLGREIRSFKNGTPITSDAFHVDCVSEKGVKYSNVHLGIKRLESVIERAKRSSPAKNAMGLNVLMFGFDSVSRMHWQRNLPKTYAYFTEVLDGVVLEGHNIVGDATSHAMAPMLTGQVEEELPEARQGYPGAKPVDGHPWIWKQFAEAGYATQWGEDASYIGTFTLDMMGFEKQPVDHYYRPYQSFAEKNYYKKNAPYCLGSEQRLDIMLNWIRQFFDAYPSLPKFSFLFHVEYSHDYFSRLSLADETLKRFLYDLKRSGYLDNTLLILMSDHGARYGKIRDSEEGKYEERLPYFSLALPKWFAEKYPVAMKNLRRNSKLLTVPFDIHATLRDVLNYTDLGELTRPTRAISLFQQIPENRSCSSAGIPPHYCVCIPWMKVPVTDEHVISTAHLLISTINSLTNELRYVCANLTLSRIVRAEKYSTNENVLMLSRGNADWTGVEFYQITIETKPGNSLYEATISRAVNKHDAFSVRSNEISRINRYGDQSYCIKDKIPYLYLFCYCKVQKADGSMYKSPYDVHRD